MRIDVEGALTEQAISDTSHTGEAEETYTSSTLGSSQEQHSEERKVLSIRWDVSSDQFVMSLEDIVSEATELVTMKRAIVSPVGKFYNPLGLLSQFVVQFKIFL